VGPTANTTKQTLLVAVAAVAIYLNSLGGEMIYDDGPVVVQNRDVVAPHEVPVADVFLHDYWGADITHPSSHKSYRPLTILTFRLNHILHGLNSFGYHLVNVALHAATTAIFYRLLLCLVVSSSSSSTSSSLKSLFPFFAGMAFALHPIHTESVANLAGRAEVLAGFFYVISIFFYVSALLPGSQNYHQQPQQQWSSSSSSSSSPSSLVRSFFFLVLSFASGLLCVLSKEIGFTLPLVLIALELSIFRGFLRQPLLPVVLRSAALLAIGLSFAYARWIIFGASSEGLIGVFSVDNRPLTQPWLVRTLTWTYLPCFNAFLLVFPFRLSCDYSFDCIPFITSFTDARNLISVAFYSLLAGVGFYGLYQIVFVTPFLGSSPSASSSSPSRNNNTSGRSTTSVGIRGTAAAAAAAGSSSQWGLLMLGLGWMVLAFLPASNLLVPVGFIVAERVLYTPSFGFCILVGLLLDWLYRTRPRLCLVIAILLCAGYTLHTLERNNAWANDTNLWRSALQVCPRSARVLYSHAGTLLNAHDYRGAIPILERALAIDPLEYTIHMMLATAHKELGHKSLALTHATRTLMLQPKLKRAQLFARGIITHFLPATRDHWVPDEEPFTLQRVARVLMTVGEHLLQPEFVSTAIALDPSLSGSFYTKQIFRAIDQAKAGNPPVPTAWTAPRGIVMCAGRLPYLTSAYISLHLLRERGCQLPVELWYQGEAEMPRQAQAWFNDVSNVRLVDAALFADAGARRNLSGYEIKPFAIAHSGFREVMLLDADNAPILDVTSLFDEPSYRDTGALFWPDYCGIQTLSPEIWKLMDLQPPIAEAEFLDPPYYKKKGCSDKRYENEFESGQLIIDKSRHWPALQGTALFP